MSLFMGLQPDNVAARKAASPHVSGAGFRGRCISIACLLLAGLRCVGADRLPAEIAIYGGTSAGVVAAVQAAALGRSVVLLEPGQHLGGMCAEGLGGSDIDNHAGFRNSPAVVGLALEFYRRVASHYGRRDEFEGMLRRAEKKPALWRFEPHVAERVFDRWVAEAGVRVLRGHRLVERGGVTKDGARLVAIRCENGAEIRARQWIDATYEGDLLAAAGVSFVVGREGNARYGETRNGIRTDTTYSQFDRRVDPYVVPGEPASGLVPGVSDGALGEQGAPDDSIQGFRFRTVLTKRPDNRVPFAPPPGYDASEFELLRRYIAAGGKLAVPAVNLPNEKCEPGVWHHLQSNLTGRNHRWNTATYAGREAMLAASLHWQQSLYWFLASDPVVPPGVREEWARWGVCRDEFTDHAGWPRLFYVRNGRRMVSDFVLTEAHVRRENPTPVEDPVALAWWPPDLHSARVIVKDGAAWNEGAVFGGNDWIPFGIAYRAIVPRRTEAENLSSPTCVSSSYVAYGALRLEWTFMAIAQATAIAASLAIEQDAALQAVPYAYLRHGLLEAGQVLAVP
jgi:hypothetical protein